MVSPLQSFGESYSSGLATLATQLGVSLTLLTTFMVLVTVWILIWKGLALWRASKKNQKLIFILLLIINDLGILELIYYFWLSKIGQAKQKEKPIKQKVKQAKQKKK